MPADVASPAAPEVEPERDALRTRSGGGRMLLLVVGALAATVLVVSGIISLAGRGDAPTTRDRLVGSIIPGFTLPGVPDGRVRAPWASHHGAVLLFFAKWCAVCHTELPRLAPVARTGTSGPVRIIGIDGDSTVQAAASFASETGIKFPVGLDPNEVIASTLVPVGYPSTVAVDADGRVVSIHYGAMTPAQLRAAVNSLDNHR